MTIYYQLEYKSGKVYQYSKTEKEGFVKHEQEKDGNVKVSFRRYLDQGLIGIFKGIDIKDGNFGKEVQLKVIDEEGNLCKLTLQLKNSKGGLAEYVSGLATYAPGLKIDYIYRFFPYSIEREDKPGSFNKGVSVKYMTNDWSGINSDFSVDRHKFEKRDKDGNVTQEGAIPAVKYTSGLDESEVTRDSKDRDKFLYGELKKLVTDFSQGGGSVNSVSGADAPKPAKAEEPVEKEVEEKSTTVVVDQEKEAKKVEEKQKEAIVANTSFDDEDDDDLPF